MTASSSCTDELWEAAASTHPHKISKGRLSTKASFNCERAKGACHATKKASSIGRAGRVDILRDCLGRRRWRFRHAVNGHDISHATPWAV